MSFGISIGWIKRIVLEEPAVISPGAFVDVEGASGGLEDDLVAEEESEKVEDPVVFSPGNFVGVEEGSEGTEDGLEDDLVAEEESENVFFGVVFEDCEVAVVEAEDSSGKVMRESH